MKICPKCNESMPDGAGYCVCGERLGDAAAPDDAAKDTCNEDIRDSVDYGALLSHDEYRRRANGIMKKTAFEWMQLVVSLGTIIALAIVSYLGMQLWWRPLLINVLLVIGLAVYIRDPLHMTRLWTHNKTIRAKISHGRRRRGMAQKELNDGIAAGKRLPLPTDAMINSYRLSLAGLFVLIQLVSWSMIVKFIS